ncbi:hypothetical protein HYQ43_04580 [Paracoccus pantotrophus]|uniref:Uncharacterized protein n=1 Tax=Paracoccus pantotrophus TaxID=82367 RepID=A0A7H9BUI2_PARPN|nr:hypothetical protein [Paracoccus pantotrophus]QLH13561.1 hypothetical protein HYQ43_04580 [Paracoccus pantotrophus]
MFFFRNHSRAFRRGFSDGMSSAFRVAAGKRDGFTYTPRATDAEAWREVGELLNQSYREVGAGLVKTTSKNTGYRKKHPA